MPERRGQEPPPSAVVRVVAACICGSDQPDVDPAVLRAPWLDYVLLVNCLAMRKAPSRAQTASARAA